MIWVTGPGLLQGANGSAETIGKIIAPSGFALLFKHFVDAGIPNYYFLFPVLGIFPGIICAFTIERRFPEIFVPGYVARQGELQ